ncbi:MAG: cysteine--tRNA ligase [Nitrososphaerales archaeon]|jgi:cysteinyl-tRNA synthetase
MLKLYNSMGRSLQTFKPIKEGEVRMYTCGPTVWNYAHVGNFRTFAFEDLLKRYLKFKGYRVTHVMNITDVEDKIIKGMRASGKTLKGLSSFYEEAFMEDLDSLGIERADFYPRATENIEEMVSLIKVLQSKGYAYSASDGSIYFDISKFKRYGALSGVKLEAARRGSRVSQDHYEEKMEAVDFALWKAWNPDDGDVFWENELGKGRPGWSLECSAMSMKYLGDSFDIHAGGMDNKFPHHENEIAQSEAATGKKFVNYWLHSEFLNVRGEEMHKSLGNEVYLRDLFKQGWDPLTIRLFFFSARYRDAMDLTETVLEQARSQRRRLQDFVERLNSVPAGPGSKDDLTRDLLSAFEAALDDDLNTPEALASIFTFVKKTNAMIDSGDLRGDDAASVLDALQRINSVLGILKFEKEALPPDLVALVERRDAARKRRDYAESDRIRDVLLARGIEVEDTPSGTRWKRTASG